jgi:hypothetical protein
VTLHRTLPGLFVAVLLVGCSGVPSLCANDYCAEGGADGAGSDGAMTVDAAAEAHDSGGGSDGGIDVASFDGGAEAGCPAPTTLDCSGQCVDPTLPAHCGTCDNVCDGPEAGMGEATCTAGMCGIGCTGSTSLDCSGACVDPSQPAHCGSCTTICPGPAAGTGMAVCTLSDGGAQCSVTCGGTTTESCSGSCYAPTDPAHCGSCGNACPAPPSGQGQPSCSSPPTCAVSCNSGYHACSGDCLPNTDEPSDTGDPCILTEAFGMFVSPSGSDTTGSGSRTAPYATIGHAMDQALTAGLSRVYACGSAGSYTENLVVGASRAGLTVYGGLNCTTNAADWTYDAADLATVAPATGYALDVTATTAFEDCAFVATPAVSANSGLSSIAVFVSGSSQTTFERCTAQAGAATAGQNQTQPAPYSSDAPTGATGGAPIVSGGTGAGGVATSNPACMTSFGGAGGSAKLGEAPALLNGQSGGPETNDNAGSSTACGDTGAGGGPGVAGAVGSSGTGAQTLGSLSAAGWAPTAGSSGGPAAVGQGGGGGGTTAAANSIGGGGAGGAGGCGGAGGAGGTAGGSSIAVLIFDSVVTLQQCALTSASAGRGGSGAAGQTGQMGGGGGAGGSAGACMGGMGGSGGNGGPGGGGAGGISAGVLWTGSAPTVTGGSQTFGTAGAAGQNGDGSTTAVDGTSGGVVQLP